MKRKMLCLSIIATMLLATACKKPVSEVTDPVVPEPEPQVVVETPVEEPATEGVGSIEDYKSLIKGRDSSSLDEEKFNKSKPYIEDEYLACALSSNFYNEVLKNWSKDFPDKKEVVFTLACPQNSFSDGSISGIDGMTRLQISYKTNIVNDTEVNEGGLFRDTIFYSVNSDGRPKDITIFVTVKANIEEEHGQLVNCEIISWAVDDEHRANFEANKLDACKSTEGAGKEVITDYDYVWSKYSDHITTFQH